MIFLQLSLNGEKLNDYVIEDGVVAIGTNPDSGVLLHGQGIGGCHAVIDSSDRMLIDKGAALGTLVNGALAKIQALENGDLIGIGDYVLRFFHSLPAEPVAEPVTWKVTRQPQPGAGQKTQPPEDTNKTIKL